ncbi:MAG: D-tyrosyl-tRNA(Tyr) deacylase [Oligosphaeraceae bacterium]|nr:D-tyrosyl-tRNA(Tyr) deacylase [Oligosphaeraceae bacterium]
MRVLLQRVSEASVSVAGQEIGRCRNGLLLLLGIKTGDSSAEVHYLVEKCLQLRIFADTDGKMNRSLLDTGGEILVISQFTLYADARKGRRPSFCDAAAPEISAPLYELFVQELRAAGVRVATGQFGAEMAVSLVNDGPVTILLEK